MFWPYGGHAKLQIEWSGFKQWQGHLYYEKKKVLVSKETVGLHQWAIEILSYMYLSSGS